MSWLSVCHCRLRYSKRSKTEFYQAPGIAAEGLNNSMIKLFYLSRLFSIAHRLLNGRRWHQRL